VLLADEPTGNLDVETGQQIVQMLRSIHRNEGVTIVMVTHNLEIARDCDRMVRMKQGQLEESLTEPESLHLAGAIH
jgi:predicted ABC-type transport system involved in lysophospholipase L1 biosynthesis ATPase subunit